LIPNVRHLEPFVAVAHGGSVSAAARALHLSQPAVTQAVAALERALGTQLLSRSSWGVALTAAGRITAIRAERALDCLREALQELARSSTLPQAPRLRALTAARLAAIVAVAEARGFSNAARAERRSRATVQRTARQIEQLLGTRLFEKTSHGIRITREAERLVRRIRLAVAEIEQACAEVAATRGEERGETVIGAMPLARSSLVPTVVLQMSARHPLHAIRLLDGPYDALLHELRHGGADFLIGALRESVPADVTQQHLFDDPLAIIMRAGHPLATAAAAAPSLKSLSEFPWLAPRRDSPLNEHYGELMRRLPRRLPAAPIECNSLMAARAILLASDRLMLLSANQVALDVRTGQLATRPHPLGRVVRKIGLTSRGDWLPTATQRALIDEVHAVAATYRWG